MTAENLKKELSFEANSSLTTLAVEDVLYKGEGNAHIVVALPHVSQYLHYYFYNKILRNLSMSWTDNEIFKDSRKIIQ